MSRSESAPQFRTYGTAERLRIGGQTDRASAVTLEAMALDISPAALGRPLADVERVHALVLSWRQERYQRLGALAPADNESERVAGIWSALDWLNGQPIGMFSDGPADSIDRVLWEARMAEAIVKGKPSRRYTVYQALGIVQLLRWAAGQYDELPGFAPAPQQRSA
jgi:hypothetical protein